MIRPRQAAQGDATRKILSSSRFISCLALSCSLSLGLAPYLAQAETQTSADEADYVDLEPKFSKGLLVGPRQETDDEEPAAPRRRSRSVGSVLPAQYRSTATSVKDQGKFGSCWAFAGVSALEANLIKKGFPTSIDLSESQLMWYMSQTVQPNFMIDGRAIDPDQIGEGFVHDYTEGGYQIYIAQMAGIRAGIGLESYWGYGDVSLFGPSAFGRHDYSIKSVQRLGAYNKVRRDENSGQKYLEQDSEKLAAVKQAIIDYGAVAIDFKADFATIDQAGNPKSNMNYAKSALYNDFNEENLKSDHAVSIIGWDDSFSKENFSTPPAHDGAWLIKNSWGVGAWGKYVTYQREDGKKAVLCYDSSELQGSDSSGVSHYIAVKNNPDKQGTFLLESFNLNKESQGLIGQSWKRIYNNPKAAYPEVALTYQEETSGEEISLVLAALNPEQITWQGYAWLSYDDASIENIEVIEADVTQDPLRRARGLVSDYDFEYAYDYGNLIGYLDYILVEDPNYYTANVFTSQDSELLKAVAVTNVVRNAHFDYKIGLLDEGQSLDQANIVAKGSADFKNKGYFTLDLDKAIKLKKDQRFAVFGRFSFSDSTGKTAYFMTAENTQAEVVGACSGELGCSRAAAADGSSTTLIKNNVVKNGPGESYYFDSDHQAWIDLYKSEYETYAIATFKDSAPDNMKDFDYHIGNFTLRALSVKDPTAEAAQPDTETKAATDSNAAKVAKATLPRTGEKPLAVAESLAIAATSLALAWVLRKKKATHSR